MRTTSTITTVAVACLVITQATASADEHLQPEVQATSRATVSAAADTYVVREQPALAYGTSAKIAASNWSTPWHSDVYARFTLPQTPAGNRIVSAKVEFSFQKLDQRPASVELRSVASTTWAEASTSYANRPALGAVIAASPVTAGASTLSFDVTSALGSGSYGLTNPTGESAAVLHSREHGADGPRLVIDYAPATTLCGASFAQEGQTWPQALAREDTLFGGLEAVRTFYGGLPAAWPGQVDTGTRTQIVSFKFNPAVGLSGTEKTYLRNWFATAPRNKDVYWIFYHEPEDQIAKNDFTAAQYRAAWPELKAMADAANNPRLHATQVLMEWTVNPLSGRNWRDYYPGDGILDVLAWDVYNYPSSSAKGVYLEPSVLLDRLVAVNRTVGLPFGIAEMGSHLAPGDAGARRATWVRAMNSYLETRGSLWNLWFDLSWSDGDYRLRDTEGVAAWRALCD